jgi:two-component system, OmpR family, response regulator
VTTRPREAARPIRIGGLVVTPGDPRIVIDGRTVYLSRQQLTLLEILANNAGRVTSIADLASGMARRGKPLTNTGIWVHMHRVRAQLKPAGVLIRTLRRVGYLLEIATENQAQDG